MIENHKEELDRNFECIDMRSKLIEMRRAGRVDDLLWIHGVVSGLIDKARDNPPPRRAG